MKRKREKENYMIQSVYSALAVLEELAKESGEIGVTELANRLKLHKNNVFRILATLVLRGYVDQNKESEDYRLGVKVAQLGQAYMAYSQLVPRAQPILKGLAESSGETVSLAVLQSGQVHFPLSFESKRPVKVAPRTGLTFPAKLSAAGRLILAQLPDNVLMELLSENTAQDAAIKAQLAELRSSGQIVDRGAIEADVVALCKVVRGANNQVLGAIEVLAPQYRAKLDTIMQRLDEAAQSLSTALGAVKSSLQIEREVVAPIIAANPQPVPNAAIAQTVMRVVK